MTAGKICCAPVRKLPKDNVKTYLKTLMTVTPLEDEYMEKFINGEYCPELLFSDKAILDRIKNHPMALWKCKAER